MHTSELRDLADKLTVENDKLHAEVSRLNKSAQGYYDEASKGWTKFRAAEREIGELRKALEDVLAKWYAELDGGPKMQRADWDRTRAVLSGGAERRCEHVWVTITHCQDCKVYK